MWIISLTESLNKKKRLPRIRQPLKLFPIIREFSLIGSQLLRDQI